MIKIFRGKGHGAPVPPANLVPTTTNVTASGDEDTTILVTLLGADPDGGVASFVISSLPANGVLQTLGGAVISAGDVITATDNAAQVNFIPTTDWNGETSFTYAARDIVGATDSSPNTATITVVPVSEANTRPTTSDASASGTEDTLITINLSGADSDGTVAVFVVKSLPANGTLKTVGGTNLSVGSTVVAVANASQVTFQPNADWNGVTTFTFAARDNAGEEDLTPATATITVTAVNDAPSASATSASGIQDTPLTVTLTGTDPDGTVASFVISSLPANGVLKTVGGVDLSVGNTVAATANAAQVVFHPTAAWSGVSSFTYTARDNAGVDDATPATASLTIAAAGDAATTLRSLERKEYDLTGLLSTFSDVGNLVDVEVTNPSGKFLFRIWKMRDLIGGDDHSFTKRELLDYAQVHSVNASPGDAMTVSFSGWTGANGTGSYQTRHLTVGCSNAAPTSVTWNPLLKAQFGGFAIHQYLPGNGADWVLETSTQFEVLRDTTPRTELGSGRPLPNGMHRVVLKARASSPNGMGLNPADTTWYGHQFATATYGGIPAVIPTHGTTSTFTLTNTVLGQSHTVTVNWDNTAPLDCAPWPLVDALVISGRPTSQINWYTRHGATYYRYGMRFRLMDGDHAYSSSGAVSFGFNFGFGTTTIGGTAPTTLFTNGQFGGKQHPIDGSMPIWNPNLITIEGQSPDTYLRDFTPSASGTNAASTVFGYHIKKLQGRNINITYSRNIAAVSHCLIHDPADPFANIALQVKPTTQAGMISNWIKGNAAWNGSDGQVVGNLIETPYTIYDMMNFVGSVPNSNQSEFVCLLAFNAWIGCQGGDDVVHHDGFQWTGGTSPATSTTPWAAPLVIGNIWYQGGRGGQRTSPADGLKNPPWAEVFFPIPLNPNGKLVWIISHNFMVTNIFNGLWVHNPAGATRIRYNNLHRWRDTGQRFNLNPGVTVKTYYVSGNWVDGVDDADYRFTYNITQGGYDPDAATNAGPLSTNPGAGGGNWTNTEQDAYLVNPLILDNVKDVSDVIANYKLKPGLPADNATEANCFEHEDVVDFRRYKIDIATVMA